MSIDFHHSDNRFTYSKREADTSWVKTIEEIGDIKGKNTLDIGCGGGIYSKALLGMGATHVTGVDFSENMIETAKQNCNGSNKIKFIISNALDTKLPSEQYDLVLERAVIHHINDLQSCFVEIFRLLKQEGTCIIQDRTPEDCLLEGSSTHIRGYFFSKYPDLIEKETSRRYSSHEVQQALQNAGFQNIKEHKLWETRKVYKDKGDLFDDLLNRTGRSLLHELNDQQLQELVPYINGKLAIKDNASITEQDRWTIWVATKN